jgi:ribonuclease Z
VQFEIKILGANSATPAYNRHQTSQLIYIEPTYILVDCGEGTQHQLLKYKCKINRIDYIFISHLHGDHYLGLIGLLSTMNLQGRTKELFLFGPKGLDEIITIQLKYSETVINYNIVFKTIVPNQVSTILETQFFTVETIPLNHRIPCSGFLFREKSKGNRLDKLKLPPDISLANIAKLKKGEDILDQNGNITLKSKDYILPPLNSRSYAYCSDTRLKLDNRNQLTNVNLIYHEATFLHNMIDRATSTFHTTAWEAANFAKACQVKQLIIGHYSSRYKDIQPFLTEAKAVFDNTLLAIEGNDYIIS